MVEHVCGYDIMAGSWCGEPNASCLPWTSRRFRRPAPNAIRQEAKQEASFDGNLAHDKLSRHAASVRVKAGDRWRMQGRRDRRMWPKSAVDTAEIQGAKSLVN